MAVRCPHHMDETAFRYKKRLAATLIMYFGQKEEDNAWDLMQCNKNI